MAKGRVLIIESDEWEAMLLAKILRDAGYQVELANDARSGFEQVRGFEPDCILCSVALPDIDGFWVARRVRSEAGPLAATPLLLLTEAEDVEARLQGLHVGADLLLSKPLRNEEVVAQVGALIDMAKRLRASSLPAEPAPPSSGKGPSALQGDLSQVSLSTVLSVLELERRTGRLKVRDLGEHTAVIDLAEGALAGASLDETACDAVALLREVLSWSAGSFQFRAGSIEKELAEPRPSLTELLLNAIRLEDEAGSQ